MGRYSSDSDDSYAKSRRKKKGRSRSKSYSSDDSHRRAKKSKKTKKSKRHSRSHSRSSTRSVRKRRSRSRDKRRHSRSKSRSRHRRSRSYSRLRRRRSSSRPRRRSRNRSRSVDSAKDRAALENVDPCLSIPGFQEMSQSAQNEMRMKMAFKAAAATDAKLREQGVLPSNVGLTSDSFSYEQQQDRVKNIQDIEGGSFTQQTFTSSKSQPKSTGASVNSSHESAIFNASADIDKLTKNIIYKNTNSLMGPIFYESIDTKWDRWVESVAEFRRQRLEGEAMPH